MSQGTIWARQLLLDLVCSEKMLIDRSDKVIASKRDSYSHRERMRSYLCAYSFGHEINALKHKLLG